MATESECSGERMSGCRWGCEFVAGLEELSAAMRECESFLRTQAVPEEGVFAVHLAMEELVTNTLKYGYGGGVPRTIAFHLQAFPNRVTLVIEDDGRAFDPFSQPGPDLERPLAERAPGGLGLHIVKSVMTAFSHRREKGKNIVWLEKRWEEPPAAG